MQRADDPGGDRAVESERRADGHNFLAHVQTGLNVGQMQVDIVAVSFEKDVARTTVSIKPKGTTSGMQMSYTLDRSGDKWVVRPSANLHPGAMPEGAVPGTVMPPGTKAPPIPPGATMPAGHPPIGKQ